MSTSHYSRRSGRWLAAALTGAVVATLAGAALPASAADLSPSRSGVKISFASPERRDSVDGTLDVTLTGSGLSRVEVLVGARKAGNAAVAADGSGATLQIDTLRFRDGWTTLTAIGWGADSRLPRALAGPIAIRIANAGADRAPRGYSLVFADEFSGTGLDRSVWCTRYMYDGGTEDPATWADIDPACLGQDPETGALLGTLDTLGGDGTAPGQEQQVYRDVNLNGDATHTVQAGYVALHATSTRLDQPYLKYESAMLRSQQEFEPEAGHPLYLTARVKAPDVVGTWPAFWIAGGYGDGTVRPPWPPEIDILEMPYNRSGNGANVLWSAVQTWPYGGDDAPQGPVITTSFDPHFDGSNSYVADESLKERWIEVGLEWRVDGACWYLDGVKYRCTTYRWVAHEGGADATNPATLLLNLAVGGGWAGADGVELTEAGAAYAIDHVRVYRK